MSRLAREHVQNVAGSPALEDLAQLGSALDLLAESDRALDDLRAHEARVAYEEIGEKRGTAELPAGGEPFEEAEAEDREYVVHERRTPVAERALGERADALDELVSRSAAPRAHAREVV